MMKSKNIAGNKNLIDEMRNNNLEAIIYGIQSEVPILNLNAIIFGTKFNVTNLEFINRIKDELVNSKVTLFGVELNNYAIASLHLLGVKKYEGNNETIKRIIKSNFDI